LFSATVLHALHRGDDASGVAAAGMNVGTQVTTNPPEVFLGSSLQWLLAILF
jgi:hypothetical protein